MHARIAEAFLQSPTDNSTREVELHTVQTTKCAACVCDSRPTHRLQATVP